MKTSYKKLFKLLIDRGIKKGELCRKADISKVTLAKMGNEETVTTETLTKICTALNCTFDDIMEMVPDVQSAENEIEESN
jgi:DNA-binding Xre family transcriptional regulator